MNRDISPNEYFQVIVLPLNPVYLAVDVISARLVATIFVLM
jgi:hypothetical protein